MKNDPNHGNGKNPSLQGDRFLKVIKPEDADPLHHTKNNHHKDIGEQIAYQAALLQNSSDPAALLNYDQKFLDSLFEGIIVHNKNAEIIIINRSAEQILELSRDQLEGKTPKDLKWKCYDEGGHPVSDEQQPCMITLQTGFPCKDVVMRIKNPDGTEKWLRINSQPVYFPGSQEPDAVTSSFVDLTQQNELLRAFTTIERNQELVLSSSTTAFYLVDHEFRVMLVNKAGEDLSKTLIGKKTERGELLMDLLRNYGRKQVVEHILRLALNRAEQQNAWHNSVNGERTWLTITYKPVFNEAGEPVGIYITAKDITREKVANLKLMESEERFRVLFNSTYQFMTVLSPDGNVVEVNRTALQFSGLTPKQVIGRKIWETLLWKNTARSSEDLKHAVGRAANGQFVRFELNLVGIDDIRSATDLSIKPIRDETGTITMLMAEGRILDEQRKVERELRDLDFQFRSFMENTPAQTWITDEFHILRYMNPVCMKVHGLDETVLGKDLSEAFTAEAYEQFVASNNAVFESGKAIEIPERSVLLEGVPQVQRIFKFPLGLDHKGIRLLGGVSLDVTAEAEARHALEQNNERDEYVRKATSDAIWDWDIPNDIIQLGEASTKIFGFTERISSMETRTTLVHPEDRAKYKDSLKAAFASGGDSWQLEYRFRTSTGRYRCVLDKAYILRDKDRRPFRMIGATQDVTKQRKLEKQLLQEAVNRKREVIREIIKAQETEKKMISDELHDNISQLLATCNLYLDVTCKQVEPDQKSLLQECRNLLQMAMKEIRNMSHSLTPAAFAEKGLFFTLGEMVQKINALGKLEIRLEIHGSEQLEEKLLPEMKTAVYRIIQEQINNTIKHAAASVVVIKMKTRDHALSLQIYDNGKGFDPQRLKRGLGLNNIQSRASLFGGTMTIHSYPGRGCLLKVSIPFAHR